MDLNFGIFCILECTVLLFVMQVFQLTKRVILLSTDKKKKKSVFFRIIEDILS